ncbi:MAG: DUF1583 domain-containing protein [Planctomycetaceae bacterium]
MNRLILYTSVLWLVPQLSAADSIPPKTASAVLDVVFAKAHLTESAVLVHLTAMQLAPEQRFGMLLRHVLPDERPAIRVQVGFLSAVDEFLKPAQETPTSAESERRAGQSRAQLVSPVLDLIDAAVIDGRLEDLRQRVSALLLHESDEILTTDLRLNQQCLLTLIELAADRPDAAFEHLAQVEQLVFGVDKPAEKIRAEENSATTSQEPSDALLIVLSRAMHAGQLSDLTLRLLTKYERWAASRYEPGARERYVMAMVNQVRASSESLVSGIALRPATESMTQWTPVSRVTAESHGTGCPDAEWLFRPGHAELMSPHERDYLMFNTPLTGSFDVECDLPLDGWKASSLLVAGRWLGPVYTQNGFDSGAIRWQNPREHFDPPLTRVRDWLHYRATVRRGTVTTYFSGRRIQERKFQHQVPWLAVRSNPRDRGMVRNVRITGQPEIPEQVDLLGDVGMGFWHPHFGESVGDVGDHWCIVNGVLGAQSPARESAHESDERLLTYYRPMLEDGEISCEFLYEPGQTLVHPALDRTVFLIEPNGIRIHQVTDGPWDQTALAPDNIVESTEPLRMSRTLPLKIGQWNQLQLRLTGDVVVLRLNGTDVFQVQLPDNKRRSFGLFHYADQTSVQVRNLIWKGDWPRTLPSVAEQELAVPDVIDPANSTHLTATFQHDFTTEGLPLERFRIIRGNVDSHLVAGPDGLIATREATGGYLNATVSPQVGISGDFDLIAEYDRFAVSDDAVGDGTIALIAVLNNATQDEFFVARRHMTPQGKPPEQITQCVTVQRFPEGERRSYFVTQPMEETSGRLKLSRRGDVLFYFTSENDSTNFQLRGQRPIAADDVAEGDLRLMTQINDRGGRISVVWKSLTVRAESLTGSATGQSSPQIVELNQQRDALPQQSFHDFTESAPKQASLFLWGDHDEWKPEDRGLRIRSTGAKNWVSSGITTFEQLEGDFDLQVIFRPEQLAQPLKGDHTQIYLQVEGSDPGQTQINSVLTLRPDGELLAQARVRTPKDGGGFNYLGIDEAGITRCSRLRLARRQSELFILAGRTGQDEDIVVGRRDFNDLPVKPERIRFMLHTGTDQKESQVVVESLNLRATRIIPPENSPAPISRSRTLCPGRRKRAF